MIQIRTEKITEHVLTIYYSMMKIVLKKKVNYFRFLSIDILKENSHSSISVFAD